MLGTSCGSGRSCERTPPDRSGCADLKVNGAAYDEWRPFHGPEVLQEIGDGTYPACNAKDTCNSDGLGGLGATDVWRLEGVDPARALVGLREDTRTRVIFVRVGVDPDTIHLGTDQPR
jgi:hypothetical protein